MATQTPPRPPASLLAPTPVATSLCEPHRAFIEAQLHLGRNAMAVYQDLVDGRFNDRQQSPPDWPTRTPIETPVRPASLLVGLVFHIPKNHKQSLMFGNF